MTSGITNAEVDAFHKAQGHTAPRITPEHIEDLIRTEDYYRHGVLTICVLELMNGFYVTGESAPASPENFNDELGRKIARRNAADKIWQLEGYRLKTDLHRVAEVKPLPFTDGSVPELDEGVQRDAADLERTRLSG